MKTQLRCWYSLKTIERCNPLCAGFFIFKEKQLKTILITGAGKGIGLSTACLAAKSGHKVIAISRNIAALKGVNGISPYSVDLSKQDEITDFVTSLGQITIDVLINNAGMLTNTSFSESDFALFEKIYKVNVFGLAELTRLLLPFIPYRACGQY